MMPPTYNANLQILQTGKHVVIFHEMIHDARIIPLDGRAHLPPGVRKLAGDSVGHWEGETLVVDTTNFTGMTNFRGAPRSTRQDILASDALHVVERFTPIDRNHIRYTFTIEDPARRGRASGPAKSRCAGSTARYSNTPATREITGSRTSFAARARTRNSASKVD